MDWIDNKLQRPKENGTYEVIDVFKNKYKAKYNVNWDNWNYFSIVKWRII
jgi:hypothetical protein